MGGSRLVRVGLLPALLVLVALALTACEPAETGSTTTGPAFPGTTTVTSPAGGGSSTSLGPGALSGNFARCPECHSVLDRSARAGGVLVAAFRHDFHLAKGAECADCHFVPTHTQEGIRRPSMANCFRCHSQNDPTAPPGACRTCHPASFPLVPAGHRDADWLPARERLNDVQAKHAQAGKANPQECALCHAAKFCSSCHQVEMPHPAEWIQTHPETARSVGEPVCERCHFRKDSCNACHHQGYVANGTGWRSQHKNVVAATGATACFKCHNSATCAHCHTTGEYKAF